MKLKDVILLLLAAALTAVFWHVYPAPKGILEYVWGAVSAAAILVVYFAFGLKALKFFTKEENSCLRYPFAFALSTAIIGTIVFAAGFAGFYNRFFAAGLLAVCAALSYGELKEMAGEMKRAVSQPGSFSAGSLIFAVFVSAMLLYMSLAAMTPPIYYDTLVYQLGVPEQYITSGMIRNMPESVFSYFPQLMQMNWLFVMLLSSGPTVKMFQLAVAALVLVLVWGLASGSGAGRKAAFMLVATSPLFMLNTARIGAELSLAFYSLLIVAVFMRAFREGAGTGKMALAGILAGAAMSVKYTAVTVYAIGACAAIALMAVKKAGVRGVLLYLALPAAIVAPYFVKNAVFTGDPLYPFLTSVFRTAPSLAETAASYVSHVAGFGVHKDLPGLIEAPFLAVFVNERFGGDIISPLFIVSILLLPLTDLKKTALPALFIVFYCTAWFFSGQVLRFLLPVVPTAALIFADAYERTGSGLKYLVLAVLLAVQACVSFYFTEKYLSPFKLFTMVRSEYISGNVSYYKAAMFINSRTEKQAKVLVLGDARLSYIQRPALAYTVFNKREILGGFEAVDEAKVRGDLAAKGISYMLINWAELGRLQTSGYGDVAALVKTSGFKNIMDKYFKKIYSDDNCDVFEYAGRK